MLHDIFHLTAADMDRALLEAMNAAIASGLNWIRPQVRLGLGLYVIGYALLLLYAKVDGHRFVMAAIQAAALAAMTQVTNYNFYVRDLFFTTLPNAFASALYGPRASVSSAQQFDILWSAVTHMNAYILSQATGLWYIGDRALVHILGFIDLAALWVCFGIWYLSRLFMGIVICIGPFLLVLFLFESTRGYAKQWVGMLIGLAALQLSSSILMRILLSVLSSRMAMMENDPSLGVDELVNNAAQMTGVFWFSAVLMFVLPTVIAIGAGGAGVAATAGIVGGTVTSAASTATQALNKTARAAGKLGMALGKATGSSRP